MEVKWQAKNIKNISWTLFVQAGKKRLLKENSRKVIHSLFIFMKSTQQKSSRQPAIITGIYTEKLMASFAQFGNILWEAISNQ